VHFSRSALRVERWLVRYPLPNSVFALLAAPSQLFLQTPKYLLVRDAERFGLELGLALKRTERAPGFGLIFHGSHVLFPSVFPQGRLQRPPTAADELAALKAELQEKLLQIWELEGRARQDSNLRPSDS
jgi:hypothetical protein